jgi:hypothetical protein
MNSRYRNYNTNKQRNSNAGEITYLGKNESWFE